MITAIFNDKIEKIPFAWNYEVGVEDDKNIFSQETIDYINTDEKNVIHYIGKEKPWKNINFTEYHKLWWKYAEKSPFYTFLLTNLKNILKKSFLNNIVELILYSLISPLQTGSKKEDSINKIKKYKTRLSSYRDVKKILKNK